MNPTIIKQENLIIAGTHGDGSKTGEVWSDFEKLSKDIPLKNALSEDGYEVRVYEGDNCVVYVGNAVSNKNVDPAYTVLELPASKYVSFDVYVSNGYDSENSAMDEWLASNSEGYKEKHLNKKNYCIEYYGTRFNGTEQNSIVEIWIPIEK